MARRKDYSHELNEFSGNGETVNCDSCYEDIEPGSPINVELILLHETRTRYITCVDCYNEARQEHEESKRQAQERH